jgi:hypothetical protein
MRWAIKESNLEVTATYTIGELKPQREEAATETYAL